MAAPPPSNSTAPVSSTDPASSSSSIASSISSAISSSIASSLSSAASSSGPISASSTTPQSPTTILKTSVTTISPSSNGAPTGTQTVVVTIPVSSPPASTPGSSTSSSSTSSTTTGSAALQSNGSKSTHSSGLSVGAKTAIAVVIPVVVVAILVILAIILWRRRKQRKNEEEQRRKEMEDYGYNPNNDPTLPAVGGTGSEMAEDHAGYRGWGGAGTMTSANTRKASTTLSGGMAGGLSDNGSQPGGYHSPGSPSMGTTDGHSSDPLMSSRREPYEADGVGALGAAPAAGAGRGDIRRGPSNASSSYSAGDHSHHSAEAPIPVGNGYDEHYGDNGYYQAGPYDGVAYGGGAQPVVRDVQARRNTRIEEPRVRPGQGNSGIAQNF